MEVSVPPLEAIWIWISGPEVRPTNKHAADMGLCKSVVLTSQWLALVHYGLVFYSQRPFSEGSCFVASSAALLLPLTLRPQEYGSV